MEEQTIISIWETFKDYIPEKTLNAAASQFIELLQKEDVSIETLEGLMGYDPHLDDAIQDVIDEQTAEDESDVEEWNDEKWDDEEDY
jgi:hypothetical protein